MDLFTSNFEFISTPGGNRTFHHYFRHGNGTVYDCGMCLNTCDARAGYSRHWTTDNEHEKLVITPDTQRLLDNVTEHNIDVFELCNRADNATDNFALTACKYVLPKLLRLLFAQANHISVKIGLYVKDAKKDQQEFLFTSGELSIMHHYDIDDSIDMIFHILMEHVDCNMSMSDIIIKRMRLHVRRIGSANEGDIPMPLQFRVKNACVEPTVETDPNNDEILATLRNMSAKNLGAEKPNAPGGQQSQSQHTVAATASTAATTTNNSAAATVAATTTDNTTTTATTVATANKRARLDVSDSMFSAKESDIPMPLQCRVKKACVSPTVEMQPNYDEILATLRNMSAKNLGTENPNTRGGQQSQHTATATASTAATTTTNNISATPTASTVADTTTDNTSATATTAATGARSNDDEPMCIKTVVVTKDSIETRVFGLTDSYTEDICKTLLKLETAAKRRKIDIASASYLQPKSYDVGPTSSEHKVDQSVRCQLKVNLFVLKICRQTRELFYAPHYIYNIHCQQTPSYVILTDVLGRVRRLAPITDLLRFMKCEAENRVFTCHCGSGFTKRKTLALHQMLHCGEKNTVGEVSPERLENNSRYSLLLKCGNNVKVYGLKD